MVDKSCTYCGLHRVEFVFSSTRWLNMFGAMVSSAKYTICEGPELDA